MRRLTKIAAVTAVLALAVTGCAKKDTDTNSASGSSDKGGLCAVGGDGPKIGLAYDIGGRGDKSFNDLAAAGTKKAGEDARRAPARSPRRLPTSRTPPRRSGCAPWPTRATTRSSRWASSTPRW